MENTKSIAAIISTARRAKGLTQQRLADQVGVNRTTLALWELGRAIPSPENMGKLILLLDLPLDILDSVPIERQSKRPLTPAERLERSVYLRQSGAIRAVWSEGRKVYSAPD